MLSPIIKLSKFFKLESERGYDNKAVLGGLDKIIPSWEQEARELHIDPKLIQLVVSLIQKYPHQSLDEREKTVTEITEAIQTLSPLDTNISKDDSRAGPAEEPERHSTGGADTPPPQKHPVRPRHESDHRVYENAPGGNGLDSSLQVLSGIGPANAKRLKELDLETLRDMLYYFPRRYVDYSKLKPINRITYGEELTVLGTIQSASNRPIKNRQFQISEIVLSDGTGFLRLTWFNQPWITNRLVPGTQISVSGKVDMYLGHFTMTNPDWELLEAENLHTNRIVPVYPLTAGITQKWLRSRMAQTVKFWAPRVPDYLPESVRQETQLVDLATALFQVHFPDSESQLLAGRARLAFDEIFLLQLGVLSQKQNWQSLPSQVFEVTEDWLDTQTALLPFTLTNAQQKVIQDIRTDLASGHPMNRLLQGDVGAGKTVVAAIAIAITASGGAQSALMAPTSILAEQHFRSMTGMLTGQDNSILKPEEIRLMIGDTPESEKQQIRSGLESGEIKLVIGTHALIEDPVNFKRLQLAVIDEQHRFGVAQRAALRIKGENPHLLVMTATPIPRSLSLTIYGDLDLSVLDEMPAGRQPVETHVLTPIERERAYQLIRSQVAQGFQAFVICPLVEKGDVDDVKAAVDEYNRLQKEIFPDLKLGLLHGRMRPDEKDTVMAQFRNCQQQILVSTSVVEVGVDIPNATVMMIEGANRFGLAQLHQFRGRVGRGEGKSICLLIPDSEDAVENERLAVMAQTNDGFVLAERDLDQRGPGDFLGSRQSGFSDLRMASLTDIRMIEKARQQAQALYKQDPDLLDPKHQPLARMVRQFWGGGKGDIS
jgi:ATP-dependent DNA helicase RecG